MNIGIKLNRLRNEDFIWVVYFFIVVAALISDVYERNFLLTNDYKSQKKYKLINIGVLTVALTIYIYFLYIRYQDIYVFKRELTKKEVLNQQLALISALLILVGGAIQLYVEITGDAPGDDINVI